MSEYIDCEDFSSSFSRILSQEELSVTRKKPFVRFLEDGTQMKLGLITRQLHGND